MIYKSGFGSLGLANPPRLRIVGDVPRLGLSSGTANYRGFKLVLSLDMSVKFIIACCCVKTTTDVLLAWPQIKKKRIAWRPPRLELAIWASTKSCFWASRRVCGRLSLAQLARDRPILERRIDSYCNQDGDTNA
jgi:hypothetical protein